MVAIDQHDTYSVRVISRSHLSKDIVQVELEESSQRPLPDYEPGSHVDIYVQDDLVRQYSLVKASDAQASYQIAFKVKRDQGSATELMCELLRVGATTRISAPRNAFALDPQARETVLICGGIGITPMVHMAMTLVKAKRPWSMHIASRDGDELDLLGPLGSCSEISRYISSQGDRLPIRDLAERAPANAHLYFCGPEGMLQEFLAATQHRDPATVHYEQFQAAPSTGNEFTVNLARSGAQYVVREGETILDVLRNAGHHVTSSCRQGICGMCETTLISGVPDHRDRLLTDSEKASGRTMLICCSRALSPELTLDL
uniref:3-chlorobenzoate-3,4-dioxygenase reductase subunit n=1 Tax=Comamonas testosteroni TaxID=285 RepID=CBAB_COMTE|nr:RecName: Full=3-chlorobenzoate-3,4-dioxygenase reductase subunit [Comamonas testosteroni]AAC45717.2 3-chlorobenzoate-3,4/4,5-dioxygenase reductase [Conidiobolus coronatus]